MRDYLDVYTNRLVLHIKSVQEFGLDKLALPFEQMSRHDLSKWEPIEFEPYARTFVKDASTVQERVTSPEFVRAWLHHIHNNPHHWQYWIFPDGYNPVGSGMENGVMEMPEEYALEMIADWHGASYAYTGSWDIGEWFEKNKPKILVHSNTARFLENALWNLGYEDYIRVGLWAHEIK